MAKDAKPAPADGAAKEAPKSKKLLIIIASVMVLTAGGGGFFLYKKKQSAAQAETKKVAVFLDLPDMTVNLAHVAGQERNGFLRLKVALELADQKTLTEVQPVLPRIIDNFQVFLRELKPSDLEGSAGFYRLKEELLRRTNAAVHPARVEAVLFKDMLVQ
jgi:flagellar FliL protein